jgi:hypothetical protein
MAADMIAWLAWRKLGVQACARSLPVILPRPKPIPADPHG